MVETAPSGAPSVVVSVATTWLPAVTGTIGPSAPDRILALDTMVINAIALIVLFGIMERTTVYFEVALLMAMVGFVGTVAYAKFMLRGDIVE